MNAEAARQAKFAAGFCTNRETNASASGQPKISVKIVRLK